MPDMNFSGGCVAVGDFDGDGCRDETEDLDDDGDGVPTTLENPDGNGDGDGDGDGSTGEDELGCNCGTAPDQDPCFACEDGATISRRCSRLVCSVAPTWSAVFADETSKPTSPTSVP